MKKKHHKLYSVFQCITLYNLSSIQRAAANIIACRRVDVLYVAANVSHRVSYNIVAYNRIHSHGFYK